VSVAAGPAAATSEITMNWLTAFNARLSRWTMYLACLCLVGLLAVVVYGVVLRYVFNDAPPYVEQLALLLVISVAMFGAAAGVRDAGHIGLDSLVSALPKRAQYVCQALVHCLAIVFALALFAGGGRMAMSTHGNSIPTLGISEAYRYLPVLIAGVLIALFSIEHLIAQHTGNKVTSSWH
jgi:TRAP-type C4-dicarboxylate transport system permease small subunit